MSLTSSLKAVLSTYLPEQLPSIEFATGVPPGCYGDPMQPALEVGYNDPSHFSGAFKRIAGFSPREYRIQ